MARGGFQVRMFQVYLEEYTVLVNRHKKGFFSMVDPVCVDRIHTKKNGKQDFEMSRTSRISFYKKKKKTAEKRLYLFFKNGHRVF